MWNRGDAGRVTKKQVGAKTGRGVVRPIIKFSFNKIANKPIKQ